MRNIKIGQNEAGQRLDKFLHKYMKDGSTSFFYKMLRKKNIVVNGQKCTGSEKLNAGDEVKLFLAEETLEKFGAPKLSKSAQDGGRTEAPDTAAFEKAFRTFGKLPVLYEDKDIVAVDKPAGMLSQKAAPTDLSANEWLIGYLLASGEISAGQLLTFRPSVCNRLDRNTSGLLLCGKSLFGSRMLTELIRERRIGKFYRLILIGRMETAGIFTGELSKDAKSNQVIVGGVSEQGVLENAPEDPESAGGKRIKTGICPLMTGVLPGVGEVTYAEAELFTGKTHQIRAHFAALGHPLLGDPKYGSPAKNREAARRYGVGRQLLHAYRVEFQDASAPAGTKKTVLCPLPDDFEGILCRLKDRRIPDAASAGQ